MMAAKKRVAAALVSGMLLLAGSGMLAAQTPGPAEPVKTPETQASPAPSAIPGPVAVSPEAPASPTSPAPTAIPGVIATSPVPVSPASPSSQVPDTAGAPVQYTLDQVLDSAALNARNLQLKQSELRGAKAGIQEAESRFWPSLAASFSASLMANPPEGISIAAGSLGFAPATGRYPTGLPAADVVLVPDAEPTYFKFDTDLNWPVFTWGKRSAALDIAHAQAELAGLQVEKTTRENRRDLQKAWFGAVMARQAIVTLKEMDGLFSQIVADKEKGYQQGTVNLEGVLDSRSKQASLRFQLTKAEQSYQSALQGIAFMAGIPPGPWIPAGELPDPGAEPDPASLLDAAQSSSLDKAILGVQTGMAGKALDIAKNTELWRPDVGLNVKFEVKGQRVPFTANWIDSWDWNLIVSLGTQVTLFDGGKQFAKIDQAQEQLNQARIGLDMADQGLSVQFQRTLEAVLTGRATLTDKQASLALAKERDKNAQAAYDNDMATREDARGAHIAWLMANLDTLGARFQYLTALADLEFMTNKPQF